MNILKKLYEFIILPFKLRKKVIFERFGRTDVESVFEGHNFIGVHSRIERCEFGYGSYVARDTHLVETKVGRYTSIGPNVVTVRGRHPTRKFVSTHPVFYTPNPAVRLKYVDVQKYEEFRKMDGKSVIIGNDVWIGAGVILIEGIKIGDGAIIGAGSVVTKNIDPYTIVAGAPARLIRKRFTEKQIEYLLRLHWWEKDEAWIKGHANMFDDIEKLMKMVKI